MPRVAVVGAGMSGLICARTLADHGFSVTVFEKSRGVGGRMSTRRAGDDLRFDHGAQYFTVRDERFRRYINSWLQDGLVARWDGRIAVLENGSVKERKSGTDRFVATPGMNAIAKHLADGLDIKLQTQVSPLERTAEHWRLATPDGSPVGNFDAVIVSAPAAQTATLLNVAPSISKPAAEIKMNGCWALMVAFEKPLALDFEAAFIHDSPISWIAKNSSKPERNRDAETWVVHASAEWSEQHIEDDKSVVQDFLSSELWKALGLAPTIPLHINAHRWRYAIPSSPLPTACLFDQQLRVAACGDWCGGPRVEGAFLSGSAAAGRIMGLLKNSTKP